MGASKVLSTSHTLGVASCCRVPEKWSIRRSMSRTAALTRANPKGRMESRTASDSLVYVTTLIGKGGFGTTETYLVESGRLST